MKRFLCALIFISTVSGTSYAAGIFGMGLNAGVSADGGAMGRVMRDVNFMMRDAGGAVDEMEAPYLPSLAIDFSYCYQSVWIDLGWEYCTSLFMRPEGSIGGNSVSIDYSRFMFPLTIGYLVPLDKRARFYFAGGVNMSSMMLQVNQSSPGALAALPAGKHLFTGYLFGLHFMAGAEAVLSRNYSLVFQYTFFMGKEKTVSDEDDLAEVTVGGPEFKITAGLRYNLDLGF